MKLPNTYNKLRKYFLDNNYNCHYEIVTEVSFIRTVDALWVNLIEEKIFLVTIGRDDLYSIYKVEKVTEI